MSGPFSAVRGHPDFGVVVVADVATAAATATVVVVVMLARRFGNYFRSFVLLARPNF